MDTLIGIAVIIAVISGVFGIFNAMEKRAERREACVQRAIEAKLPTPDIISLCEIPK